MSFGALSNQPGQLFEPHEINPLQSRVSNSESKRTGQVRLCSTARARLGSYHLTGKYLLRVFSDNGRNIGAPATWFSSIIRVLRRARRFSELAAPGSVALDSMEINEKVEFSGENPHGHPRSCLETA